MEKVWYAGGNCFVLFYLLEGNKRVIYHLLGY